MKGREFLQNLLAGVKFCTSFDEPARYMMMVGDDIIDENGNVEQYPSLRLNAEHSVWVPYTPVFGTITDAIAAIDAEKQVRHHSQTKPYLHKSSWISTRKDFAKHINDPYSKIVFKPFEKEWEIR